MGAIVIRTRYDEGTESVKVVTSGLLQKRVMHIKLDTHILHAVKNLKLVYCRALFIFIS